MRQFAALCFFFVGSLGIHFGGTAQVVTTGADSARVATPPPAAQALDTTQQKGFKHWSRPAKAAFYSAVLPGLGQAYNKSYWKIPLVYATGAVIGFFIYDNNRKYQDFSRAIRIRFDGDPSTIDAYAEDNVYGVGRPNDQGSINLRSSRDFFRKYRDLDIILGVLAWGLNVMEAHVDAHLKAFDVSEDLSLQVKPNLLPLTGVPTPSYSAGLSLQLTLK
ncbi:DUF5683 domain-containing protein [Rufibacter psychrotolerans]|uniref:DUF5683 domain-containing protein n=1 Tax=Rufibacter psychrotolerans TaxID=2812556 RepID=UPI00196726BB|nr:DUF5683 domain-containing protein [Rufibacter sp. SYSU D00308]